MRKKCINANCGYKDICKDNLDCPMRIEDNYCECGNWIDPQENSDICDFCVLHGEKEL